MNTSTLSLHSLRVANNEILTETGEHFDVISYSRFKYGDGEVSEQYGKSLAQAFIDMHEAMLKNGIELCVTSASYHYVPKGATSIAFFFAKHLNIYLDKIGKPKAILMKISNNDSFVGDYASFSGEKRDELMKKSEISISENVEGKKLVIIDDIRITGAGERRLLNFFADKNVSEIFLLYIAVADPAYAADNPQIESIINHSWMDGPDKLLSVMHSKDYMINARVCKYLLSYPRLDELEVILRKLDKRVLAEFHENIMNDNHPTIPEYKDSIALVKKVLAE